MLQDISLANNSLGGTLPAAIGNLGLLTALDFAYNSLE